MHLTYLQNGGKLEREIWLLCLIICLFSIIFRIIKIENRLSALVALNNLRDKEHQSPLGDTEEWLERQEREDPGKRQTTETVDKASMVC